MKHWMVLRFSALSASCWSLWLESSSLEIDLVTKIVWMQPWLLMTECAGGWAAIHPWLETPQRSLAGDTAEGDKAWLLPWMLMSLVVIGGETVQLSACKYLRPAIGSDLICYLPRPKAITSNQSWEHTSWQGLNGHCFSLFAGCLPGATGTTRDLLNWLGPVLGGTCALPMGTVNP